MARRETDQSAVITDARLSRSEDIDRRQRRYVMSMTIRTICFVTMFFVPGVWRIVAIAGAALIPAIAVVLANARDNRTAPADLRDDTEESAPALALTAGEVIRGEVHD